MAEKRRRAAPPAPASPGGELGPPEVGAALRRLRHERGLSLEELSQASGVSRAMLNQIELGRSTPTVTVVWKIAQALGVPFTALLGEPETESQLLRARDAKWIRSRDGQYASRALFLPGRRGEVEFYELWFAPGSDQKYAPHDPGTTESIVVASGSLVVTTGAEQVTLQAGDALTYPADRRHRYQNASASETRLYCVITYRRGPARDSGA